MWTTNKSDEPPRYPSASAVPTYPAVSRAEEPEGWCERNNKNKPQSNSVGAGALIFMSGGMFLAGPGKDAFNVDDAISMGWFIGGLLGAFLGAILCNRIPKKLITCFASILVSLSGILLVADPHSYGAMLAARYLNGGAVGLIFPLTFVLAGEEVVKSMRGMNAASVESMCFTMGVLLQVIYANVWPEGSFDYMQMLGSLSIVWGFVGFIIAFAMQIESPIFYLARGQEEMAIDTLRRLQRPFTVTYETYEQLQEHKHYLAESREITFMESARIGLPALIKLCFYRSFTALSYSFYTNFALSYASTVAYPNSMWPYYFCGSLRLLGTCLVVFTLDSKGRKPPMMVGFFCCCCLSLATGGLFSDPNNSICMAIVVYLLLAYQLFAGLSTTSSSAYLSEAFPLAIKPYYVAFVFMCEMLVHIIIIASRSETMSANVYDLSAYFYTVGALSLAFFVVAKVAMPETKWNTLRECLTKFRNLLNQRS